MPATKYTVKRVDEMPSFSRMLRTLKGSFAFRTGVGEQLLGYGHYANVLDLGTEWGLAISTDGVGTKIRVAEQMRVYDTIGIDCVAMNVNDVICVGAEPIAMTDYIATAELDDEVLPALAVGFLEGARQANITIPGGEIAQIPEITRGLDLVGTCVGLVRKDDLIIGDRIEPGNAIIGFASSGIHSNGLTLARTALAGADDSGLNDDIPEFGCKLWQELLRPTRIYVQLSELLKRSVSLRALAHITSDGFLNLQRFPAPVGFRIEFLPELPPVFSLIQRQGVVTWEEMFYVYNMGVGLCAIVPESDADAAIDAAKTIGIEGWRLGSCTDDTERTVDLKPVRLKSDHGQFVSY